MGIDFVDPLVYLFKMGVHFRGDWFRRPASLSINFEFIHLKRGDLLQIFLDL